MSRRINGSDHAYVEAYQTFQNTQSGKVLFTRVKGRQCGMLIQNDRLKAVQVLPDVPSKIGAVYIAKVKNIVKNLNACFVEIVGKEICFLSFTEVPEPEPLNRSADGRLLEGDEILVMVTKDAHKTKQAVVTTRFVLGEVENAAARHRVCFSCIREPQDAFVTFLEKVVCPFEYTEILTDDTLLYEKLKGYVQQNLSDKKVKLYEDVSFSLSMLYALGSKIDTALDKRIWLRSGGYLVIEPTEAMTVIDVNSGKYDARKTNQEAIYKINLEAAEEIALQLRLRNLSGIIMVDFINMKSGEYKEALLDALRNYVSNDRQKTMIVDMTPLGLVEITRKRERKNTAEQFKE